MGYAINGSSMRAVDSENDLLEGEAYHDELPSPWPPAPSLDEAKTVQLASLATSFQAAVAAPVTDSNGIVWDGGQDSALALDGAIRIASAAGLTTVTLYDANNTGHSLDVAAATAVVVSIGSAYQTMFATYQALKSQIAAASSVEDVQAVVWSVSGEVNSTVADTTSTSSTEPSAAVVSKLAGSLLSWISR